MVTNEAIYKAMLLSNDTLEPLVLCGEDCLLEVENVPLFLSLIFLIIVGVAYVIKKSMIHQIHHIQT